jgi:hypothetical protein
MSLEVIQKPFTTAPEGIITLWQIIIGYLEPMTIDTGVLETL